MPLNEFFGIYKRKKLLEGVTFALRKHIYTETRVFVELQISKLESVQFYFQRIVTIEMDPNFNLSKRKFLDFLSILMRYYGEVRRMCISPIV